MLRTEDLPMFSSRGMAGASTAGSMGGPLAWLPPLATVVPGIEPEQFHSGGAGSLLVDRPRTGARAVTGTASAIARSIALASLPQAGASAFAAYPSIGGAGGAADGTGPGHTYSGHFLSANNSAGPGPAYLTNNEQLSLRFSMSLDLEDPNAGVPPGGV
jgi:hypothetical protein